MKKWTLIALLTLLPTLALAAPPTSSPTASQRQAFERLSQRYKAARAVWQPTLAGPQMVTGLAASPAGKDDDARARSFLARWETLFGVSPAMLRSFEVQKTRLRSVARFGQVHDGLEVLDRFVALTFDLNGTLLTVASDAVAVDPVKRGTMSLSEAAERAIRAVTGVRSDKPAPKLRASGREVILAGYGGARHAWAVRVVRTLGREHLRVVVDARNGKILQTRNMARH